MKEPIEELIDRYQQDYYLSGNIHISKEGKTLFSKSYGQASIQLGVPNNKDTKFHIASVTKMFIAAATLKLYEQGLIRVPMLTHLRLSIRRSRSIIY
ncbi:serine hydrolase [Paenibacillus sp. NPDC093718]|uniref:serine hydrolase n=1 Tax=Paenibacillus sp. NPDC093718 TaxID=3390601 RepID=UPI003D07D758